MAPLGAARSPDTGTDVRWDLPWVLAGGGNPSVDVVPRSGLGTATFLGVLDAFGTARAPVARRAVPEALEAANRIVQRGLFDGPEHLARALTPPAWLRRVLRPTSPRALERLDDAMARYASWGTFGERPVPETVLFLRACVGAAAIVGEIPAEAHRELERAATWTGLAWERALDQLDPHAWHGALEAIGDDQDWPADAHDVARRRAADLLAGFDDAPIVRGWRRALERLPRALDDTRQVRAWRPRAIPAAPPPRREGSPADDAFLAAVSPPPPSIDRALRFLQARRGKGLRGQLVVALSQATESPADPRLAAALIEWLHLASLVIDDVVDGANVRRGAPTLHVVTDAPFALGVAAWVLFQVARASRALPLRSRGALLDAALALVEGQHGELRACGEPDVGVDRWYPMVERKTARLFECAAILGASTADDAVCAAAARFGKEVGIAFQALDDVLDYDGCERALGKSPGVDLTSGKPTLPWILGWSRLPPARQDAWRAWFTAGPDSRRQHLDEVTAHLRAAGALDAARAIARDHLKRAEDALAGWAPAQRAPLTRLAAAAVERTR